MFETYKYVYTLIDSEGVKHALETSIGLEIGTTVGFGFDDAEPDGIKKYKVCDCKMTYVNLLKLE